MLLTHDQLKTFGRFDFNTAFQQCIYVGCNVIDSFFVLQLCTWSKQSRVSLAKIDTTNHSKRVLLQHANRKVQLGIFPNAINNASGLSHTKRSTFSVVVFSVATCRIRSLITFDILADSSFVGYNLDKA